MKRHIWLLALGIGVANAILLYVFELIGVDGTDWLWDDVFHTDTHRWLVPIVAIILGLAMTAVIRWTKQQRVVSPNSNLMDDMNGAPSTIPAIGIVLAVGAISLLAGGSIGPEASLMAASAGIGAYAAHRWRLDPTKQLLILASIGSLLVTFLDSLVLLLLPILLLFQSQKKQNKHVALQPILVILLAGIASFATLGLINHLTGKSGGYGTLPTMPEFAPKDFLTALVLGFVASSIALSLNWLIQHSWRFAKWLDGRKLPTHDWVLGAVFGAVLGGIYLLGGQTVEFSGSIGSGLLVHDAANYGAWALVGLVVSKLLATAWSKGTGYRGGLVFPSIYMGVALGLLVGQMFSGLGGAGAMIGGIAGIITAAVGSPIVGSIFLISILPVKLWPVAACAILGTVLFDRLRKRLFTTNEKALGSR